MIAEANVTRRKPYNRRAILKTWPEGRAERVDRMWDRARLLLLAAGGPLVGGVDDPILRLHWMTQAEVWLWAGWTWASALEPTDFCLHDQEFRPLGPPEPTYSPPGTAGKLQALAGRIESGVELWHPEDRTMGLA